MFVSITGGSGSGKTYISKQLEKIIIKKVTIIKQDNYYNDLSNICFQDRGKYNFDVPDAIDFDRFYKDLLKLKNNEQINCPTYDFKTHTRLKKKNIIHPNDIIIVEGIFVLTKKHIRDLFKINIYIDSLDQVRQGRRLERDYQNRGRDIKIEKKKFQDIVLPNHKKFVEPNKKYANYIIKNNTDSILSLDKTKDFIMDNYE